MDTADLHWERYLVAHLFSRHQEGLRPQPFESEADRWLELATSFIMLVGEIAEEDARMAASLLSGLGILDVIDCATISPTDPRAEVMEKVLVDHGCQPHAAALSREVLVESARVVQANWEGKIQRCLRAWGRQFVDELAASFQMESVASDVVRAAFALLRTHGSPISSATDH